MTRLLSLAEVEAINARNRPRVVRPLDAKPEPVKKPGREKRMTLLEKRAARQAESLKLNESAVLNACALILETHPAVAFWWRQNTGIGKFGDRYVKFSFKGASDLMAVLKDGARFLACECKATGERPSEDQENFLANVNQAGGIGVWCDHPDILLAELGKLGVA